MVTPNQTQMNEFLEGDIDSPISMVNSDGENDIPEVDMVSFV